MEVPYALHCGDCREVMARMDAESVDAVVSDPPYGLSFMGKEWDHGVPGEPFWAEALRVAKPGAHLVAFGGSRTFHRLVCAVEDAGWEIRDVLMWLYGSGFPKSLDVSKAIDKEAGVRFDASPASGVGFMGPGDAGTGVRGYNPTHNRLTRAGESTDAARQWSGWGTALKPAYEPIILARKPLRGTVARNVQTYGTGAINVDGCRVDAERCPAMTRTTTVVAANAMAGATTGATSTGELTTLGRWPANILLDEAAAEVLDAQSGESVTPSAATRGARRGGQSGMASLGAQVGVACYGDRGGASRFFYTSKASGRDRGRDEHGNDHPTVKPTDLMRWLCRLVTPPGGLILDPFMGSGSTGVAAITEGFRFLGVDIERHHVDIAERRLADAARQPGLFG